MADDLLPPIEIPWRFAATTQLLTAGEPDQTTITFFTFEPDDDVLIGQFPKERLVFLKVTVSISPAAFPPGTSPVAAAALGEGIPCFHMLLDMKVSKGTQAFGTDRPYFHAAAPLRRQMLQTGVIGTEVFEGESYNHSMGKSGSQVHETGSSSSSTSSLSGGFSVSGIGLSGRTSTTDVASARNVTQVSDTTTRDASQERRELVSYSTKVDNILTLLNAKYVGTPYLSFSLSPRPLQQLSVDSSDPSLWFSQLLHRRSSGIEGLQEFTAVIVVPKNEDFCVMARLRRVCLLDDPPGPPNFGEPFDRQVPAKTSRLFRYLFDTYPIGTPLDDLDIDITGTLAPNNFQRPVIEMWGVNSGDIVVSSVVSPGAGVAVNHAHLAYKHAFEVWLETLRDEYERDLVRSPLERGVLVGENRFLTTCFSFSSDGLKLLSSRSSVSALSPLPLTAGELDIGGLQSTAVSARKSVKARAQETVMRWNALEQQLATLLGNARGQFPDNGARLNDQRIVDVLIQRWAKLRQDDPRNLDFGKVMEVLKLKEEDQAFLKAAGVTDLKSLARALQAAPVIERYNSELTRNEQQLKAAGAAAPQIEPLKVFVSQKDAAKIRKIIGDRLLGGEQ